MSTDQHSRRLFAARCSKGISSEPIHAMASKLLTISGVRGALLEFGAGTASLLRKLSAEARFTKLVGADILPRPAELESSIHWIEADLNEPLQVEDEAFDVLVSTEVIEHLENPRAAFREFHRLLKAGGFLILTTPNQESIRSLIALLCEGHFAAFRDASYPAHLTALLRKDLERLCKEASFDRPQFTYTNDGGIPKVPLKKWQQVSFGLLKGRLFSDNIGLIARKSLTKQRS